MAHDQILCRIIELSKGRYGYCPFLLRYESCGKSRISPLDTGLAKNVRSMCRKTGFLGDAQSLRSLAPINRLSKSTAYRGVSGALSKIHPRIENFSTRIAQNIKNNAPQKLPLLVEKCINSTSAIGRECISNCSYP